MNHSKKFTALCALVIALTFSCKKENRTEDPHNSSDKSAATTKAIGDTIRFGTNITQAYTQAAAETDFTTMTAGTTWKDYRAELVADINDYLSVKMNPTQYAAGGLVANFNIPDGTYYEVSYRVRFPANFTFGEGGKLGFGFGTGNIWTGEDNPDGTTAPDGLGGSARIMWKRALKANGEYKCIFKPYLYYTDMPADNGNYYGTNIVYTNIYPKNDGSITRGIWYTVKMRIKSNTNAQADGEIRIKINNDLVLAATNIKWGYSGHQQITELLFHTFRGGNSSEWLTGTWDTIHYDDVVVKANPLGTF